ncbi:MAG: fatty acid desaturase [Rhodothalassiaceae bacterium]
MSRPASAEGFPLSEARAIVKGLARPDPRIYWADFLASALIGWSALVGAVLSEGWGVATLALIVLSALALYRAVIFIHELAHLKKGSFGGFRFIWNLLAGIPMLSPSFTYSGVHTDHHLRKIYGTHEDGEYVNFAAGPAVKLVGYVLLSALLPLFFIGRFLILTPLSYFVPPLRRWLWARASSLTIDMGYRRPPPGKRDDATWRLQEAAAMLYALGMAALLATGLLPLKAFAVWYLVAVLIFFLNSLRTLAAHAYRSPGDKPLTAAEEFLDSVNVPGHPLISPLWAPVGLRFHATHHLFPSLPYHALGEAHRRLVRELPDNRLYLKASRKSLFHALSVIFREAHADALSRRQQAAMPERATENVQRS